MCTCTLPYFHTPPDWCCTRVPSLHAFAHPQELLPRGVGAASRMCFSMGGVLLLKPVVSTLALPAQAFPRARLPQCPNLSPSSQRPGKPGLRGRTVLRSGQVGFICSRISILECFGEGGQDLGGRGSYLEVISVEQTLCFNRNARFVRGT